MQKIKLEEQFEQNFDSLFEDDFEKQQISVIQNEAALENSQKEIFLDNLLSLIKLIFLYIPGAMMIHFVGMTAYFYILFSPGFSELLAGLMGALVIGTFLTMFGIGKLSDLNYLKVPASILAGSVLISIIFAVVTIFTGVQMTGIFLLMSFPPTIALGYFVKRFLDKA